MQRRQRDAAQLANLFGETVSIIVVWYLASKYYRYIDLFHSSVYSNTLHIQNNCQIETVKTVKRPIYWSYKFGHYSLATALPYSLKFANVRRAWEKQLERCVAMGLMVHTLIWCSPLRFFISTRRALSATRKYIYSQVLSSFSCQHLRN